MGLEKEIEAFNRQAGKLDFAFKKGAFGLGEAIEIVEDFNTLKDFFQSGEAGILSRIVQMPSSNENPAGNWDDDQVTEGNKTDEQSIPGTSDKIARKR